MQKLSRRNLLKLFSIVIFSLIERSVKSIENHFIFLSSIRKETGEGSATMTLFGTRGVPAHQAAYKTQQRDRGSVYYPNDLRTVWNNPGSLQTYEQWMQAIVAGGANLVRLKLTGRNRDDVTGVCCLEPPPCGTFNIWNVAIDALIPGDLPGYRAAQVTLPVNQATWDASNLGELVAAAENNNVMIEVIMFEYGEFIGDWDYHPWNSNNDYIDGTGCDPADQGFIANATDIFTDASAIAAAKDRIDFLFGTIGQSDQVVMWSIFTEIPWLMVPSFWGEPSFNAATIAHIRTKVVPWVEEIATYVKDNDSDTRLIGMSHARTPNSGGWSADPDNYWNVMNEPFAAADLTCILHNHYFKADFDRNVHHRGLLLEKYGDGISIICDQYLPIDDSLADVEEVAPYYGSKKIQWLTTCGLRDVHGPVRWTGLKRVASQWQLGGYADSDIHDIAGIAAEFCSYLNPDVWGVSSEWDSDLASGQATDYTIGWGDGENVLMMIIWTSSGAKDATVTGLTDGIYDLRIFDWVTGLLDSTQELTAVAGSLTFNYNISFDEDILVANLIMRRVPTAMNYYRRRRL